MNSGCGNTKQKAAITGHVYLIVWTPPLISKWLEGPSGFTDPPPVTPLDEGKAMFDLCQAIQSFMPENFIPAAA